MQRLEKTHADVQTAMTAGDFARASKLVFEQQESVASLRHLLSDCDLERQREEARVLFGLPTTGDVDELGNPCYVRPAIIYCDPPWAYTTKVHAMGTHELYDSLSDAELAALPVAGLAAEDAALLMWATLPKLDAAHRIMNAWGFEFRAVFLVWNKVARYYGRPPRSKSIYTRPNAEVLLLGIRGSMPSLKAGASNMHSNVLLSRVDDHSHKPEVVRQLIVETFGDLPRIELFARQTQPDWLAWGNEITGSITPATALASNIANPRKRKNRMVGDSIKRALVRRRQQHTSRPTGGDDDSEGEQEDEEDEEQQAEQAKPTEPTKQAKPAELVAPHLQIRKPNKSSQSTLRYLERYEQYNETTHNRFLLIGPPDAEQLEHEAARTRFVAMMEHPNVDNMPRGLLSSYLSPLDLFACDTLASESRPASRTYPRLSKALLREALPTIRQMQLRNSDHVFALANHLSTENKE